MPSFALTEATIWHGDVNIATHTATVTLDSTGEELDNTTFSSGGARTRVGGLEDHKLSLSGYIDNATADPEEDLKAALAAARVVTIGPRGGDQDDPAYLFTYMPAAVSLFGPVGQLAPFKVDGSAQNGYGVVAGTILTPSAARTTGANGDGYEAGAVAAGERAYATLHVLSGSGGTLTVKIESDDNSGFTSPTERIAFTATTGVTAEFASVAGAITDTYWRATWTVTAGTFTFGVGLGIR